MLYASFSQITMMIMSLISRHRLPVHTMILRSWVFLYVAQSQLVDARTRSNGAFLGLVLPKKTSTTRTMMTATPVRTDADTADFSQLFLSDAPLMDVRAPVEFIKGAFPHTENFPILNDEHRALVGTCYKEEGSDAAKQLGYELVVESNLKEELVDGWKAFAEANPNGYLYCFRGGMRSHITQLWLKEAGIDYPLVQGGYKAMRTFLMSETERLAEELPIVLIGGRTGSGKTHLLKRLGRHVDLEGLAKHRGSSFGRLVEEQPAQIDFENSLGIDLIKAEHDTNAAIFMEDEGRRIGQRTLPVGLFAQMSERYPLVILEEPMEERVKTCIRDYVTDLFPLFQEHFGPDECGAEYIKWSTEALFRVKKRLGGDRYAEVNGQITTALESYLSNGDESGFKIPVRTILGDFYDPMYDYQLEDRKDQVLFRGTADEIVEWAKTYSTKNYAEAV